MTPIRYMKRAILATWSESKGPSGCWFRYTGPMHVHHNQPKSHPLYANRCEVQGRTRKQERTCATSHNLDSCEGRKSTLKRLHIPRHVNPRRRKVACSILATVHYVTANRSAHLILACSDMTTLALVGKRAHGSSSMQRCTV